MTRESALRFFLQIDTDLFTLLTFGQISFLTESVILISYELVSSYLLGGFFIQSYTLHYRDSPVGATQG